MGQSELTTAIEKSWSAASAFRPERWSEDNPAAEHCAVTALVVQDYLGGDIIKCEVAGDDFKHFFNRLPDGAKVDLTRSQFPPETTFENHTVADRDHMLSHAGAVERYEILRAAVAARL